MLPSLIYCVNVRNHVVVRFCPLSCVVLFMMFRRVVRYLVLCDSIAHTRTCTQLDVKSQGIASVLAAGGARVYLSPQTKTAEIPKVCCLVNCVLVVCLSFICVCPAVEVDARLLQRRRRRLQRNRGQLSVLPCSWLRWPVVLFPVEIIFRFIA